VRNIPISEIDANYPNRDRRGGLLMELFGLTPKVADHAVDLLDHRLGEDLHLGAYLHIGCRAARD
jgi:hypothetical protein